VQLRTEHKERCFQGSTPVRFRERSTGSA
jgi:hypothetical protein